MTKVGELYAEVGLKGTKEAAKGVENLARDFGFLGSAASGALKILEWGANILNEGVEMSHEYAKQIDIMAFRNKIGADSFQRLDQAFKQHNGRVEDFISVYENLQNRQARWRYNQPSQMEATAFAKLGINYNDYLDDTVGLMDAITQKLLELRKTNVGEANMWADILGFNSEFLRIAEKGNYTIYDNLLTNEQLAILNKQTENWNNINNAVDQLKMKLGAKWSADWGMDISAALLRITNELNDAANSADGFWASLWNVAKKGANTVTDTVNEWTAVAKGDKGAIASVLAKKVYDFFSKQETPVKVPENLNKNQAAVYKALSRSGLDTNKIAGIMGNIQIESSFDPTDDTGDNGTSIGLAQWHLSRAQNLKNFAALQGKDWQDTEVQIQFLLSELRDIRDEHGKTFYEHNFATPQEATDWMVKYFEKPVKYKEFYQNPVPENDEAHIQKRRNAAAGFAGYMNQPEAFNRLAEQAAISNSSKNITVNTDAKVYISANNVDTNLTTGATAGVLKEGINIAAQDYTEDNNG